MSARAPLALAPPPTDQATLVVVTTRELRAIVADELAKHRDTAAPPAVSEWLTADDAAAFLHLHPRTLARMAAAGEIGAAKIGRQARYRRADLEALFENRVQKGHR